jgi:hypothetical protein
VRTGRDPFQRPVPGRDRGASRAPGTRRLCPCASGRRLLFFFVLISLGQQPGPVQVPWPYHASDKPTTALEARRSDRWAIPEALRSLHHRPPLWFGARGEADCFFLTAIFPIGSGQKKINLVCCFFFFLSQIDPALDCLNAGQM